MSMYVFLFTIDQTHSQTNLASRSLMIIGIETSYSNHRLGEFLSIPWKEVSLRMGYRTWHVGWGWSQGAVDSDGIDRLACMDAIPWCTGHISIVSEAASQTVYIIIIYIYPCLVGKKTPELVKGNAYRNPQHLKRFPEHQPLEGYDLCCLDKISHFK
jgi:hypothetical protein